MINTVEWLWQISDAVLLKEMEWIHTCTCRHHLLPFRLPQIVEMGQAARGAMACIQAHQTGTNTHVTRHFIDPRMRQG